MMSGTCVTCGRSLCSIYQALRRGWVSGLGRGFKSVDDVAAESGLNCSLYIPKKEAS